MSQYQNFMKEIRFKDLCRSVKHCTLCTRLHERKKVFSEANGNVSSKIIFVAEAPGRLGADRTGVPLSGDKTGQNFEELLNIAGWKRENIFITNALLCNPRKENGNNGNPTLQEIKNCAPYLEMTIELIRPEVIIALGSVALRSLNHIFPHTMSLKEHVGKPTTWNNTLVVPLYHPGQRARLHRSSEKQAADFRSLARFVNPIRGIFHECFANV